MFQLFTQQNLGLPSLPGESIVDRHLEGFEYVKFVDPDSESLRGYFYLEWD